MKWTPWQDWRVCAAACVALAGITAAGYALGAALADHPVQAAASLEFSHDSVAPPTATTVSLARLEALAPFDPARSDAGAPAADVGFTPSLTLVGTVAGSEQPAAICRLNGADARILHIGDTIGGWRLQQVFPGRALFIGAAGARHELRLSFVGN